MTRPAHRGSSNGVQARIWGAAVGVWAAIVGAAPHVLHHAGPLSGAAIVSGTTGRLVFAMAGFVLTIPLLRGIRRHTGSWRAPLVALVVFATIYVLSSVVIGPRLTGSSSESNTQSSAPRHSADHDEHSGGGNSG